MCLFHFFVLQYGFYTWNSRHSLSIGESLSLSKTRPILHHIDLSSTLIRAHSGDTSSTSIDIDREKNRHLCKPQIVQLANATQSFRIRCGLRFGTNTHWRTDSHSTCANVQASENNTRTHTLKIKNRPKRFTFISVSRSRFLFFSFWVNSPFIFISFLFVSLSLSCIFCH